MYDIVENNILI